MTEVEKVIKGLNKHCNGSMFDRCDECPYYKFSNEPFECRDELLEDVFTILKEQEPANAKIIERENEYPKTVFRCGNCNGILYRYYKFCPECGREVKW